MNTVYRTKGIRKMVRKVVLREETQKFVMAGDKACAPMMREVRFPARRLSPSDNAILAWAMYDLSWEIVNGFWDAKIA